MKKIIFLIIFSSNLYGFSLEPNTGRGFNRNTISIHIANTSCSGAGFSTSRLKSLIEDAVEKYWNAVPTSALNLKVKSVGDIDIAGDTHDDALAKVSNNTILAGCNDSAEGFSSGSTLGSAVMSCDGSTCKSVFIINAHTESLVPTLDSDELKALMAHEIGHAFGLGHSTFKHSLMYYSIGGKFQQWLGEDDIEGVNYLYPHDPEVLGLFGSCATITDRNGPASKSFIFSFMLGILLMLFSLLVHSKKYR